MAIATFKVIFGSLRHQKLEPFANFMQASWISS